MSESVVLYIISTVDAVLGFIIVYFFNKINNMNDRVLTLENNTSNDMKYMKERLEGLYKEFDRKIDDIRDGVKELKEYVHKQTHEYNNEKVGYVTLANRVNELLDKLDKNK